MNIHDKYLGIFYICLLILKIICIYVYFHINMVSIISQEISNFFRYILGYYLKVEAIRSADTILERQYITQRAPINK